MVVVVDGRQKSSLILLKNFFISSEKIKFFRILKLLIEFHSDKKLVSPKLENCAHLYIVNYQCAKFQRN